MDLHDTIKTQLPDWEIEGNCIRRVITTEDFTEALALMNVIGEEAELRQHHPDWCNSYNKLDIRLSTHDAGGITHKDVELAKFIDSVVDD